MVEYHKRDLFAAGTAVLIILILFLPSVLVHFKNVKTNQDNDSRRANNFVDHERWNVVRIENKHENEFYFMKGAKQQIFLLIGGLMELKINWRKRWHLIEIKELGQQRISYFFSETEWASQLLQPQGMYFLVNFYLINHTCT